MNLNDHLPGWLVELLYYILALWEEKQYLKALFACLATALAGGAIVIIFWLSAGALLKLLMTYGVEIAVLVGTPFLLYWMWKHRKKTVIIQEPDEGPTVEDVELSEEIVRESLSDGVSESVGLVPMRLDTNLKAPKPCLQLGACWAIECIVGKRNAAVAADTVLIKSVLQQSIERTLKTGNTHGLANSTYIYHQHSYCILQVAYVLDFKGFVIVGLVWASDNYFKQGDIRKYRANLVDPTSTPSDPDLH